MHRPKSVRLKNLPKGNCFVPKFCTIILSVHEAKYFTLQTTCMEVTISLSCLFVHEPLYQTKVLCGIYHHGY